MHSTCRWALLAVLGVTATAVSWSAQTGSDRGVRYAFLVGCSHYDKTHLRPLPYTIHDVEAFKKALQVSGFDADHIVVLHDEMKENRFRPFKKNILTELELLLSGMERDDTLVVALSGHGLHFKGEKTGYFCPVDARLDDKTSLLPMDGAGGLFQMLKGCKAGRKLLIVNACRNDPTTDLALAAQKIDVDDEDSDIVPEGIAALYSCRQGQKSYYDPDRKLSLFYDHLVRAWKGEYQKGFEKIALEDVFRQVVAKTKLDANKTLRAAQVPEVRRDYKGEWIIADGPGAPLFNGVNLTGWKVHGTRQDVWTVDKGTLISKGGERAWLGTLRDYADFELYLEYRIGPGGNSGIYLRYPEEGFASGTYGLELQLLDDADSRYANLKDHWYNGSIWNVVAPSEKAAKPAGEWNQLAIRAQGKRVSVVLNGVPLFNGKDLTGWRNDDNDLQGWSVKDGFLQSDAGPGKHLWSVKEYGDFELTCEWRFTDEPKKMLRSMFQADGTLKRNDAGQSVGAYVLDAGNSGIFLRGTPKAEVNIWCWPIGSGELWHYRFDADQPADVRAAATPKVRADNPPGQWNQFLITMKGDRLTVVLNGRTVIANARLADVPERGPIGLQKHTGTIQFNNILIRESP